MVKATPTFQPRKRFSTQKLKQIALQTDLRHFTSGRFCHGENEMLIFNPATGTLMSGFQYSFWQIEMLKHQEQLRKKAENLPRPLHPPRNRDLKYMLKLHRNPDPSLTRSPVRASLLLVDDSYLQSQILDTQSNTEQAVAKLVDTRVDWISAICNAIKSLRYALDPESEEIEIVREARRK